MTGLATIHNIEAPATMPEPSSSRAAVIVHVYNPMRLFEWIMTIALILMSLPMIFVPDLVVIGGMKLKDMNFPTSLGALLFLAAGAMRGAGLLRNGSWPFYGPLVRTIGAGLGALLWVELALVLALAGYSQRLVPTTMFLYGALVIGEIESCRRAMRDARSDKNHPR